MTITKPLACLAVLAPLMAISAYAAPADAQGGDGFLFRQPLVTISLRGGYLAPRASGDLFDHTVDQLTLSRPDFGSAYLGVEAAVRATDRMDLALGLDFSGSEKDSEFRDWVDTDDRPIEQVTEFGTATATLGVKYYLRDRGQRVGRFAWVPAALNVFVGAGAGVAWYEWRQSGDWVDFLTLEIFGDTFVSKGAGLVGHIRAGADVSVTNHFGLTGEARYRLAEGPLNQRVFKGFTDGVDMSGLGLSVGVSVRF